MKKLLLFIAAFFSIFPLFILSAKPALAVCTDPSVCWAPKTSISVPLTGSGIASDPSGKIYLINGYTGNANSQTLYAYDITNNTWIAKAPLPYQGNGLALTYNTSTNKFYAGGGWYNTPLHNFYEYDPVTDTWTAKASMIYGRDWNSLVSTANGKIYAVGGDNDTSTVAPVEEYDPATDTWTAKASLPTPTTAAHAVLGQNGKIYIIGGHALDGTQQNNVQEYDPTTDTWTQKTAMPIARSDFAMTVNGQGNIDIIGGITSNPSTSPYINTQSVEEYHPSSDTWTDKQDYPLALHDFEAALGGNGLIYVFGGIDNYGTIYDSVYAGLPPSSSPKIVVNGVQNTTINEGITYLTSGSYVDPNGTSWTATVDYGDNSGSQGLTLSGTNFLLSHAYKDNGTYTVTVSVTDNQGATGTATATVTVNNDAPSVGTITAPTSPVQVNTAITASAGFTDQGVLDTHTASWNWGDGNTTTGSITESNGSGSVSNSHTYTATGVYIITLNVTDKDGGAGTSTYQYVAVYDSTTSFAGGKSFSNPSGATPNTSGKVSFGLSAKYNNNNVLIGNAKMNFKAANLDFSSTSLSLLATSNGKAYLKGSGKLNGTSGYMFLATGIDGSIARGNDMIRLQIKDSASNVVYDTQPGAGDTTDPTTIDAAGNIRVH